MKLETQMKIAANLKQLRHSKGLSQAQLSSKVHMDRSIYALYESGRRTPDLEFLYMLSKFFGIRMELLFDTDPERVISEAAYYEVCDDGDIQILTLFRDLSPFSKGRLLEKAETLAEWDAFRADQLKELQERSQV